jgi:hypothetical protein
VSHKAGEFRLDLEGEWQNDTEVEAYLGFGELTVQLPDDMRVDVERAGVTFGTTDVGDLPRDDELPEDARTIQLSIGGIAGEHRVSP